MSSFNRTSLGPVAIIPASAIRNNRWLLQQIQRSPPPPTAAAAAAAAVAATSTTFDQRRREIPINLAYYSHRPESVDRSNMYQRQPRSPPSCYHQGGDGGGGGSPSLTARLYRTRSYTTNSIFNEPAGRYDYGRAVSAVSGPVKYPEPLYRKKNYGRSLSADWIGAGGSVVQAPSTIRRPTPPSVVDRQLYFGQQHRPSAPSKRSYLDYPASYVTYPPSTAYRSAEKPSDHFSLRMALKIAQLVVGAVVIGTVVGPASGEPLSKFLSRTQSGGQLYVVVIAAFCMIFTAALLLTLYYVRRSQSWRNVDGVFNATAAFFYLVGGCVEAWYANCYPPYGNAFPETCRLVAWAIGSIFAFMNMVLYAVDFMVAAQSGIDF